MKRSDMVDLIHNYYWDNYPDFEASDIVTIIEEAGMLPPKNPNKYDPVPTVTPTGHNDYSFIREWEEE